MITRIPPGRSLIVLLNNTGTAPLREMTIAINRILYDGSYELPKKSIALSLSEMIEKNDLQPALSLYKEIKESRSYYLDEYEMNTAGYSLLRSGKTAEAAAIFKLIVEAYPYSFNACDSYGEALKLLGDTARAIEYYIRSVQLNPGNENGLKALRELGARTDTLVKKITVEELKLLEGRYTAETGKDWTIAFSIVNEELQGSDNGYRFRLVPAGGNTFVNPADGVRFFFDTKNKKAIMLVFSGQQFRKVM